MPHIHLSNSTCVNMSQGSLYSEVQTEHVWTYLEGAVTLYMGAQGWGPCTGGLGLDCMVRTLSLWTDMIENITLVIPLAGGNKMH